MAREASGVLRGRLAVQSRRNPQAWELDVTKIFLDTNILVYANDQRDPAQTGDWAIEALATMHGRAELGVISTQVLAGVRLGSALQAAPGRRFHRASSFSNLSRWRSCNSRPALIRRALEFHCVAPDQLLGRRHSGRRRSRALHAVVVRGFRAGLDLRPAPRRESAGDMDWIIRQLL